MQKNSPENTFTLPVIGIVHSSYKKKFGIPRQPGLVPAALAQLEILPPYNVPAAFDGLQQCSHIWLQFIFHKSLHTEWRPKVRPPRLGGNKTLGVFATRSPVRPSPIGLSVVKLESIDDSDGVCLNISGADLLHGTPVVDIKPYVPYADSLPQASFAIAEAPPAVLPVVFSPLAESQVAQHMSSVTNLRDLVIQILQQDPRPSYKKTDAEKVYAMQLDRFDIRWRYYNKEGIEEIEVLELISLL